MVINIRSNRQSKGIFKTQNKSFPIYFLSGILLFLASFSGAIEFLPVASFQLMGGQHFFQGANSSVGGNVAMIIVPAIKFSDRLSLLPTYSGRYRGTKDVTELAGGGTLFQEAQSHSLNVKTVYAIIPGLKIKPSISYRTDLLRETKDESWGKGLFDWQKFQGGIEFEKSLGKKSSIRLSYDYFLIKFPNYQSLESQQDLDRANGLGRELSEPDVLDTNNHMLFLSWKAPSVVGLRTDLNLVGVKRSFIDQHIVSLSGELVKDKRLDESWAAEVKFMYPISISERVRLLPMFNYAFVRYNSDQNHYDARKTTFLNNYYGYVQFSYRPGILLALGEGDDPATFTLNGVFTHRMYDVRPHQNPDGDFLSDRLRLDETNVVIGFAYPVSKGLKIRATGILGWSDSNTDYQKVFRYDYKISNYLVGFSYEY